MYKASTKFIVMGICLAIIFTFTACASKPKPSPTTPDDSAARSRAAGRDAQSRLDTGGTTSIPTRQTTTTPQVTPRSSSRPAWVDNPEAVYNRDAFVSAVGNGTTRDMSEKDALAKLSAFFGQSIEADQQVISRYNEVYGSGDLSQWTQGSSIDSNVRTKTSLDELVGADIREVWQDPNSNRFYAVAVMDKDNTARIYNDLITENITIIDNLISMSEAEKNSLSGYSRYQLAAIVADINIKYRNILSVIGSTSRINLPNGNTFRMIMQDIARATPIGVTVDKDNASRIQTAFVKGLSDNGFGAGNRYSRYLCDVNVDLNTLDYPNSNNIFVRIIVTMNLRDTQTNTILTTWNMDTREGHVTKALAENRAYTEAEKRINEEFGGVFKQYLAKLTPRK